jgi:hypothetical protein
MDYSQCSDHNIHTDGIIFVLYHQCECVWNPGSSSISVYLESKKNIFFSKSKIRCTFLEKSPSGVRQAPPFIVMVYFFEQNSIVRIPNIFLALMGLLNDLDHSNHTDGIIFFYHTIYVNILESWQMSHQCVFRIEKKNFFFQVKNKVYFFGKESERRPPSSAFYCHGVLF